MVVPWSTQGTIQRKPAVIHSYPWSIRPQIQLSVLKKFFFSGSLKGVQFLAGITTFQYTDSLTDLFQQGPLSLGKKPCPQPLCKPIKPHACRRSTVQLGTAGRTLLYQHTLHSLSFQNYNQAATPFASLSLRASDMGSGWRHQEVKLNQWPGNLPDLCVERVGLQVYTLERLHGGQLLHRHIHNLIFF